MYKAIIFNTLGQRFEFTTYTLEYMIERLYHYRHIWEYYSFALVSHFDGFAWSSYITIA